MATPAYNAAGQTSSSAAASSLTLSSFSAAAGSNRFLEVWVGIGTGGTLAAPTSVTWGGQSLTQRGTHQTYSYWGLTKWTLKEADFPSGATGDIVATWAASHDERMICALVHADVDQTTPQRGSVHEELDSSTNSPSVTVSSNADDVVTAGVWAVQTNPSFTGIANSAGTERCDTGPIAGGYEIASVATVAGSSPTISWTISNSSTAERSIISADSLVGASAGSAASLPLTQSLLQRIPALRRM